MNRPARLLAILAVILLARPVQSELRLPSVFTDGMVLQRERPVHVWGRADAGSQVRVVLESADAKGPRTLSGRGLAGDTGRWMVRLEPDPARPLDTDATWTLGISEHHRTGGAGGDEARGWSPAVDRISISDVLVGEVWICGGQSNMEWSIDASDGDGRSRDRMANPRLRLIDVPHRVATSPREDVEARWESCTEGNLGDWTAVGYFFGERLNRELGVPVGLISSNWGGTRIEPWIDREDLAAHPRFAERSAALQDRIDRWNRLDREELRRLRTEAETALADARREYWEAINAGDPGHRRGWMAPATDDSEWEVMQLPAEWERASEALADFDGTVWFRRTVELPGHWRGRGDVVLDLGGVDDSDQTYLNGRLIGTSTDLVGTNRRYPVPPELLEGGRAQITVCALDPHGAGGMIGPRIALRTLDGEEALDLRGPWRWRRGYATNRTVRPRVDAPSNPGAQPTAYGALNDAMISPFVPYSIRGAIWYQGESNAGQPEEYRELLPLLIESWRGDFGEEMAFGIVQLAAFKAPSPDPDQGGWATLRDAQRHAHETVPGTGLVVTTDVGDARDIHPRNKKAVGDRLAGWALHDVYGIPEAVPSGPIAVAARLQGPEVLVEFSHARGGLMAAGGGRHPGGFALAGPDGRFRWAEATIEEPGKVRVVANGITEPVLVSYGWQDNPVRADLVNGRMLPACPFKLRVESQGRRPSE